jgi:molybdate transport system ATP-binding protein
MESIVTGQQGIWPEQDFTEVLKVSAEIQRNSLLVRADVSFAPGEVVSISGPNGSGKSTLLMAIAGLVPVDAGRITRGDDLLDDAESGAFVEPHERGFSACFQDARLFPHMSVIDNIGFSARCAGMSRKESRRYAAPFVQHWRLEAFADTRPPMLSGGQQRLVSLARATATPSSVLLLDEPTANLDVGVRQFVRERLLEQRGRMGQIVIIVSHDADDSARLATRSLTIVDGVVQSSPSPGVAPDLSKQQHATG